MSMMNHFRTCLCDCCCAWRVCAEWGTKQERQLFRGVSTIKNNYSSGESIKEIYFYLFVVPPGGDLDHFGLSPPPPPPPWRMEMIPI